MADHPLPAAAVPPAPHTAASHDEGHYLPGMGHDWLLPLYDPLTRALGLWRAHRQLLEQAGLGPGRRVLEIGCGTGNVALMAKRLHPEADVVGLDPDPRALARAERKARRAGRSVRWDRGFAGSLPYPDGSFDRVLSSFMLHHLDLGEKRRALHEACRVLVPGGTLHVLDFGGAKDPADGFVARRLHDNAQLRDNFGDRIPSLMREAGLVDAGETGHRVTRLGRQTFYRAARPGA